jgi:hypothetical protein
MFHSKRYPIVAVIAVLSASVSCKKTPDNPPQTTGGSPKGLTSTDGSTTITSGGGGTHTTNSVLPEVYSCTRILLEERMKHELVIPATPKLVLGFDEIFKYGELAERLVEYAVGCAISTPVEYITKGVLHNFPSGGEVTGLLTATGGWTSSGLSTLSERVDLHTCIATRLNPSGQKVDIWLEGDHVAAKEDAAHADPLLEAYWSTTIDTAGPLIHIWPSKLITDSCPVQNESTPDGAITRRICGKDPAKCKFKKHDNISDCKPVSPSPYMSCPSPITDVPTDLQPVITTKLTCAAFCKLYPDCNVPKGCADQGTRCNVEPPPQFRCEVQALRSSAGSDDGR